MGQSDPYQHWSGAPKHWVEIPAQRQAPPPDPWIAGRARPGRASVRRMARRHREAIVIAVAVAVATTVILLAGTGTSVAHLDGPAPEAVSPARP